MAFGPKARDKPAQSKRGTSADGRHSLVTPGLCPFSSRFPGVALGWHGSHRGAQRHRSFKVHDTIFTVMQREPEAGPPSIVAASQRRGAFIAPSRCGRSAPHQARGVGSTEGLRSPMIFSQCHAHGWQRRGATAARGRYHTAPPCSPPRSSSSFMRHRSFKVHNRLPGARHAC